MSCRLLCLMFLSFSFVVQAKDDMALVHIRLIDGRSGLSMKVKRVGLEDRAGYRDISVSPDASGWAVLRISRDTVILTHNTHEYVNCGDEHGGLVHNDYNVSEIMSAGIVEQIVPPNRCHQDLKFCKAGRANPLRATLGVWRGHVIGVRLLRGIPGQGSA